MKRFLSIFIILFISNSLFSQVWDRFYPTDSIRFWKIVELNDYQLVSVGTTPPNSPWNTAVNTVLFKTNANGGFVKSQNIGQGFVYDLQFMGALFVVIDKRIVCYDTDFRQIWTTTAANEYVNRIRPLSNGNLVTLSATGGNDVTMHVFNSQNGSLVFRQKVVSRDTLLVGRLPEFTVLKDNIYAIINDSIWKISGQTGRVLTKLPFGAENLFEITTAADQTLLVSKGEGFLYKIDTLGRQIWQQTIRHKSWTNTFDKEILVTNEINDGRSSGELSLLDKNGKMRWFKPISNSINELPFQARASVQTSDGNFVVVGNTFLNNKVVSRIVKVSNDNQLFLNRIVGTAYIDYNGNCKKDTEDIPRANWLVYAKNKTGEQVWSMTDARGQFVLRCDTGVFDIKMAEPSVKGRIWQSCVSRSTQLTGLGKTDSVNLFQTFADTLGTVHSDCILLQTDIGLGPLRPCTESRVSVNYANLGNLVAENAYITVQLDPKLAYLSATRPLSNQTGQFYKFNLGNIVPSSHGNFIINVRIRCGDTVKLGQTICLRADAFPDSSCTNTSSWTGANLSISGICETDSVAFTVKNIGTAPSQSRKAVIIENDVQQVLSPIQLAPQAITTRRFPANGHTWRMTIEQDPNHPISLKPTAFVEGCRSNTNQNISFRFVNNFAFDDNAPSVAQTCGIVSNSYDPNDKVGYPLGTGKSHNIEQNQDITYKIRFQNTGTDTAFKVVIRDTIDTRYLDLESIEMGASSHPYTPMVYDKNIIQFTFDNILLPDSFRNEPASNGFVQFRIKQKKDLAFGTQIENSAGIYFDFNKPVITNISKHTIAKPIFSTVKTLEINNQSIAVDVSPNPFESETVFKIIENPPLPIFSGSSISINGIFYLYDINGRLLRHDFFEKSSYTLMRKDLGAGMYIYKIQTKDGRFASGKVAVF